MVTKRSIYSKLRSFYDYLKDLGDLLPFFLFVLLPYLFDQVNGYSVTVCIFLSAVFITLSSLCWLEFRERYLLEVKYQKLKDIGDETQRFVFFKQIEAVIGIKVAAIVTILYIMNILTLNCLLIKWLNGDIIDHLFHFIHHDHDNKYSNDTSTASNITISSHNGENLNLTDKLDLIKFDFLESKFNINEFLLNVFIYLVLFLIFLCKFNKKLHKLTSSQYNERERLNGEGNSATTISENLHIRDINRLTNRKSRLGSFLSVAFQAVLFATLFFIIYLSVFFNSMHLKVKCERFFKIGFNMIFLGTSITIGSFNSLLMNEVTRLPKRKSKKQTEKPKLYNSLMAKYAGFSVFILIFLALQDLFNPFRNEICDSYLNSLLDSPSHTKEIIKKLLLTVMCVYITSYFYKQLQIAFDNAYALFYSLLKRKPQQKFNAVTNVSTVEIRSKPCCNGKIDEKLKVYRKIRLLLIFSFFFLTALKLIFTNYFILIHIWSATFLLMNLSIMSIILLLHYFPYQIFIGLKDYMDNIINLESSPVAKKSNIYKAAAQNQETPSIDREQPEEETTVTDVDNAFKEYKLQLRDKILKNKEFNFGTNQPNMKSAYKILFAYILFLVFSFINSILMNYLQNERKLNLATLLVLSTLLTVLFTCKLFLCLFIYYQPKETLYVAYLKRHSVNCIPFLQLLLSYLNVYFLLKLSKLALSTLFVELIIVLFIVFLFVQFIRFFNISSFLFLETTKGVENEEPGYDYSINMTSISLQVDANNDVSMASNINLV